MKHLDLDSVIKIYLGESGMDGTDIKQSKETASKEIQRRTLEYRNTNNVDSLVSEINSLILKLKSIDSAFENRLSISIVNSHFLSDEFHNCEIYSIQKNYPGLNLLNEYYFLRNKLIDIWANDPEYIRHSSKFLDRRCGINSQEYFTPFDCGGIFTKTTKWSYNISAILGFDYMPGIVNNCIKSNVCLFPINAEDRSEYELSLIFHFMIQFSVKECKNATLWFVIYEGVESVGITETIINNIRTFIYKLCKKSGFTFDSIPYTTIINNKDGGWSYDNLISNLDDYAKCKIEKETSGILRHSTLSRYVKYV